MAGIKNGTLCAKNADYTQADGPNATSSENNGLVTDGKLWIGSTALNAGSTHINVGSIVSTDSSITVGYSSPNITIVANGSAIGKTITGNSGGSLSPVAGNWNIFGAATGSGTNPVSTAGAGNTLTVNVQRSQAIAATSATKVGLAAFDSTKFTVDANGFVSTSGTGVANTITADTGGGLSPSSGNWNIFGGANCSTSGSGSTLTINVAADWTEVTNASVNAAVNNGYILNNAGLLTVTLPSTYAVGDEIRFCGKGAGLYVLQANAGDTIHFGNQNSSSGGTVTATNRYDTVHILGTVANTEWTVLTSVGNFTIA